MFQSRSRDSAGSSRSHSNRKFVLASLAAVVTLAVAACGASSSSSSSSASAVSSASTPQSSPASPSNDGLVALVSTQAAGDKGPVDDMISALSDVESKLGVETRFVEASDPSTYESTLRSLGDAGAAVVVTTFNEMTKPIQEVAPDYPATKFIQIFGDPISPELPNVVTISYDYYQGAYLAGILAAKLSTTGSVGYVGGANIPPLVADYNGFVDGAHSVDPNIKTKAAFVGSFQDPDKGRSIANALYADGADVLFTDAAGSDLGVLDAAKEKGTFMIAGSESFLDLGPENVPAAVPLHFGDSLYQEVEAALGDSFVAGAKSSGVKDGAVELRINDQFLTKAPVAASNAVKAAVPLVDAATAAIKDGTLTIPLNTEML